MLKVVVMLLQSSDTSQAGDISQMNVSILFGLDWSHLRRQAKGRAASWRQNSPDLLRKTKMEIQPRILSNVSGLQSAANICRMNVLKSRIWIFIQSGRFQTFTSLRFVLNKQSWWIPLLLAAGWSWWGVDLVGKTRWMFRRAAYMIVKKQSL